MNIQDLIAAVRTWQAAYARYERACEETALINDGKSYPSSPERRLAIKALDAAAMEVIHDVHNDEVLAAFVALADEVQRLQEQVHRLKLANMMAGGEVTP